jgi:hypothetical protein
MGIQGPDTMAMGARAKLEVTEDGWPLMGWEKQHGGKLRTSQIPAYCNGRIGL